MVHYLNGNLFESDENQSYWHINNGLEFKKPVCNGCHDLLMTSPDISNIAIILAVQGADCHCIIYGVRKSDEINFLKTFCI